MREEIYKKKKQNTLVASQSHEQAKQNIHARIVLDRRIRWYYSKSNKILWAAEEKRDEKKVKKLCAPHQCNIVCNVIVLQLILPSFFSLDIRSFIRPIFFIVSSLFFLSCCYENLLSTTYRYFVGAWTEIQKRVRKLL